MRTFFPFKSLNQSVEQLFHHFKIFYYKNLHERVEVAAGLDLAVLYLTAGLGFDRAYRSDNKALGKCAARA